MPNYKYSQFLRTNTSSTFDGVLTPGTPTPSSGIYRCESCGFEVVSTFGHPLPPTQVCPNHSPRWQCAHGPVRWRLVAAAIHTNS